MKMLGIISLILVVLIVLVALIIVVYKFFNGKLAAINEKLNDARSEFDELTNEKYDLITKFIEQIVNKYKLENKLFDNVKEIPKNELNNIENDNLINKCYKELLQIKEDNQKTKEIKVFREIIEKYEDNELHLISLRTFYNKYAVKYNNVIKKFPYSLVTLVNKYKTVTLLEGKEIDSEFINDMEV